MRERMAAGWPHVAGAPRRVHGRGAGGGGRCRAGQGPRAADWRDTDRR